MKILTRKFGEVEVDEDKILTVHGGLLGFEGLEKYILLSEPKTAPLCWLQSIEEPNLSLVVVDPYLFEPDYAVNLDELIHSQNWKDTDAHNLIPYVVVNLSEETPEKQITTNLLGPIIINPRNNEMAQMIISDANYVHDHIVLAA